VRGIVAAALGRGYLGVDLRSEQVESNLQQAEHVARAHKLEPYPQWAVGDSFQLPSIVGGHKFAASFTCPPYFNLEVYSKDPRDLSNTREWTTFKRVYKTIVQHTVDALADDTFAVWVVGEIRHKTKPGGYYGLVPLTIRAFEEAGAIYYNEAVILTMLGTVPIRTSSQFGGQRKMGKAHQNVLVFVKGDPQKAAAKVPVEEVAIEQGGAVWRADGSTKIPATGEIISWWGQDDETEEDHGGE